MIDIFSAALIIILFFYNLFILNYLSFTYFFNFLADVHVKQILFIIII